MRISNMFTKRTLLTAAVVVIAAAAIVLILLLTGRDRGRGAAQFSGGADTPYPYAWTENADGTVLVSPCAAVPEGYAWLVSDSDPAVAAAAEQSAPGAPAFLLTPTGAGDCFFELDLADAADREDVLCRLVMTVESAAGKTLSASVTGSRLELRDGVLRGGGDFGAPYRIRTDENGALEIRLSDTEKAGDWRLAVKTQATLGAAGVRQEDGEVTAKLNGLSAGDAAFVLYSPARGLSLEVSGRTDGENAVAARTHEMRRHEDWIGREDGFADADVVVGGLAAPAEAEDVRFGSINIGRGVGIAATMEFRYLDVDWEVTVAPGDALARIIEKEFTEEDDVRTFFLPAGLLLAVLEEDSAIAWCAAEERTYYLAGSGAALDPTVLLETAGRVVAPAEE